MLLYSRITTVKGGFQAPVEWATEITAQVNSVVEPDVTLMVGGPGYPGLTLAWSAVVESRAQIEAANMALMGDAAYHELAEKGLEFWAGPYEERLRQVLHGSGFDGTPGLEIGGTAVVTTATPANGRIREAVEFGINIADYFHNMTAAPVLFGRSLVGTFGELAWIAAFENAAQIDKVDGLEVSDVGYGEQVAAGQDLFVPGSGHRGQLTRIV